MKSLLLIYVFLVYKKERSILLKNVKAEILFMAAKNLELHIMATRRGNQKKYMRIKKNQYHQKCYASILDLLTG